MNYVAADPQLSIAAQSSSSQSNHRPIHLQLEKFIKMSIANSMSLVVTFMLTASVVLVQGAGILVDAEAPAGSSADQSTCFGRFLNYFGVKGRSQEEFTEIQEEKEECPICLDRIDKDEGTTSGCEHLACRQNHRFHKTCLGRCKDLGNNCPMCRGVFSDIEPVLRELSLYDSCFETLIRERYELKDLQFMKPGSLIRDFIDIGLGADATTAIITHFHPAYSVKMINREVEQAQQKLRLSRPIPRIPMVDTGIQDLLRDLGVYDSCFEILAARGYDFNRLQTVQPAELRAIGLGAEETRTIVTHFDWDHPAYRDPNNP